MVQTQQQQQQRYELGSRCRSSRQRSMASPPPHPPLVAIKAETGTRHRHSASLQERNTFPRVQLDATGCGLGISSSSGALPAINLRRVPSAPLLSHAAAGTNSQSRRSMSANICTSSAASSWAEYRFPGAVGANKASGRPLSTISNTSIYTAARSTPILPGQAPSPQIIQGEGSGVSASRTSTDCSTIYTESEDSDITDDQEQYVTPDPSIDAPHQYNSVAMSPSCRTSSSASSVSFSSSSMSRTSSAETSLTCPSPVMTRSKTLRPMPLCESSRRRVEDDALHLPTSPKGTTKRKSPPSQWTAVAESRRIPFAAQLPSKGPYTFPSPTPIDELKKGDLETTLRFTTQGRVSASSAESSAPPAFFPLQRVSFAPQLKVRTAGGVPLAISSAAKQSGKRGIAGMMLGVTGTIEILDAEKGIKLGREVVRTQRMIADFATDLTNGLKIWRRDATPIVREKIKLEKQWRAKYDLPTSDLDDPSWEEMLAPGTFMLPLSMKIPCSDKLPPSFESPHFRIRYTMSLAIFGSLKTADGKPEVLHVQTMPFHILPSTLPTPPPHIPVLTHDTRRDGFFAGISRALSLGRHQAPAAKQLNDKTCTHIVCPTVPTSSFSPGSVIPVTLKIADCPAEPTDLYIRLSLIRKLYVRDSTHEAKNEWCLPDDMFMEEFCKEEEEIVSRWGYVPYSIRAREGAMPGSKAQVIISDITLPVAGADGQWSHGYSSGLDLSPAKPPSMQHGECSWFAPTLANRSSVVHNDYQKHVHASSKHFVSVEIGFAPASLTQALREVHECIPDMEIPLANAFTMPRAPSTSGLCGLSLTNPFPSSSPSAQRTKRANIIPSHHAPQLPAFPGKMKEILIPVTIGSVAEPQMSCIASRASETAHAIVPPSQSRPPPPTRSATSEESAERAARDLDETEAERYERVGDDGEEAWLCPPPNYTMAITSVPAYA